MNKKILLAVGAIILLLVIFLTTEEKKDYLTEETYWKKTIESITYRPPSEDWKGEDREEFIEKELILRLEDKGGMKKTPLFSVETTSKETNSQGSSEKLVYEAGYNAKNLFNELSVFKIKSVTDAKPSFLDEYSIDFEKSPKLTISDGKKDIPLHLGKEIKDQSLYAISDEKFLLSATAHTFRRFRSQAISFRERNLVSAGNGYLKKIRLRDSTGELEIENNPTSNKGGGTQNVWRRNSGTRLVFDPKLGDDLDSVLKSLRYEMFPDEEEDGLAVIQELMSLPKNQQWEIWTSEGRHYKIVLFSKTLIGDKEYRPTLRLIDGKLQETPAYSSDAVGNRLSQSVEKIRKATPWQRPEKQIK
jgi:hypothetical protein